MAGHAAGCLSGAGALLPGISGGHAPRPPTPTLLQPHTSTHFNTLLGTSFYVFGLCWSHCTSYYCFKPHAACARGTGVASSAKPPIGAPGANPQPP